MIQGRQSAFFAFGIRSEKVERPLKLGGLATLFLFRPDEFEVGLPTEKSQTHEVVAVNRQIVELVDNDRELRGVCFPMRQNLGSVQVFGLVHIDER